MDFSSATASPFLGDPSTPPSPLFDMSPLRTLLAGAATAGLILTAGLLAPPTSDASSHREAPLIADDPLADNTDVYAYRDPNDDESVIIVANYIPLSHPEGGPNYNHFGENVRYEIHVKNQTSAGALGSATDDITYRFTFERVNEDPSTFFNIRLGAENINTSYTLERSTDGGASFQTIVTDGATPPANIGPRSIESGAGLGTSYDALVSSAITTASTGETVFAGPRDDPFFVDLGGVFDLGGIRQTYCEDMSNPDCARDAVAGYNTHALVLKVPISTLQKDGMDAADADNILDPNYVIGVWASASRPQVTTLSNDGSAPTASGPYVQVSRLGMPLTNEAIIPIGEKDRWNYISPYDAEEQDFIEYFANPELGLYMGNGAFGPAVPGLSEDLVIQQNSLAGVFGDLDGDGSEGFNFNTNFPGAVEDSDGVYDIVEAIVAGDVDASFVAGTAFDDSVAPLRPLGDDSVTALAGNDQPRLVDIFPIFYFGVPNLAPYQLVTGKTDGNPLTEGKPFIHNFLPITQTPDGGLWGGDMLRLNMATPTTDRSSDEFDDWARLGLIRAAAIGLTVPDFANTDLEFIPHMDGFPNGRRLQDDVTGIELQAVGGLVLTAVGLLEDDYTGADYSGALITNRVLQELDFTAGPVKNDVEFMDAFPYLATPFRGYDYVRDQMADAPDATFGTSGRIGVGAPQGMLLNQSFPNPSAGSSTVRFQLARPGAVRIDVYDVQGRRVQTIADRQFQPGAHDLPWDASSLAAGTYLYRLMVDGELVATKRATVVR